MFPTAVIVFREILEASLLIGIVAAAARSVAGYRIWIAGGLGAGLAGAVLIAVSATAIANAAEGMGQELLNAGILFLAVAMLGWHSIWMSSHGRELAAHARETSHAVATGDRPMVAIAVIVAAAVLREGSETVLFLLGIAHSDGLTLAEVTLGTALGAVGGIAAGALLYLGLLRIPARHLFAVTNMLILLLAAGLASQGAGFLIQAGYLPAWIDPVWDTSRLLDESSLTGKVLHALVGYVSRPSATQVAFYLATLLAISSASWMMQKEGRATLRIAATAIIAAAVVTGLAAASGSLLVAETHGRIDLTQATR